MCIRMYCCHPGLDLPASKRSEEHISDTSSQLSEKQTTPEPGDPRSTPEPAEMSRLVESAVAVKTLSITLDQDASQSSSGVTAANSAFLTDPHDVSCSQPDEDTTDVSVKPEAKNSHDIPDNQTQDSGAIAVVDAKAEAIIDQGQANISPDNPQNQLKGTGQNFCQDSDSECLIEQVEGGETCDTAPAQTVRVLPAGGAVVADQESEETLPDIRSDVRTCSQPDEDTTDVSVKPEAKNSHDIPDNQTQDSGAIDAKAEAIIDQGQANISPDNPKNQLKGTGQESECLIEQVEGGETRDTAPAQTVRVLPAGGAVVADQELEETLPDIRSDVGSHIPVPLVGRVAGEM